MKKKSSFYYKNKSAQQKTQKNIEEKIDIQYESGIRNSLKPYASDSKVLAHLQVIKVSIESLPSFSDDPIFQTFHQHLVKLITADSPTRSLFWLNDYLHEKKPVDTHPDLRSIFLHLFLAIQEENKTISS